MECLIVLAHELNNDDTLSEPFRLRLLRAVSWLYENDKGICIISGGKQYDDTAVKYSHIQEKSCAEVGKEFICKNYSINRNRVILDEKSTCIPETVVNCFKLMEENNCTSFKVLCSDWNEFQIHTVFSLETTLQKEFNQNPIKYNGKIVAYDNLKIEAEKVLQAIPDMVSQLTRPMLLVIAGPAASGKSTLGKRIAKKRHWCYIDKGTCTKELVEFVCGEDTRESDKYKEIQPLEYRCAFNVAEENLKLGNSVVLILPMISQIGDYDKWLEMTKDYNFENVKFLWLKHNEDTEYSRMKRRNANRDKWKLENWKEYCESLKNLKIDEKYNAIQVDSSKTEQELENEVLSCL